MIIVLGSINVDIVVETSRLPTAGETVIGSKVENYAGGKGSNQALAARRAGSLVRLVGSVGKDDYAETALSYVKESGVDLTGVSVADSVGTGSAHIFVDTAGENQIVIMQGANATVGSRHIEQALSGAGPNDVLLLQLEIPVQVVAGAMSKAKALGVRTIVNLAPFNQEIAGLLTYADVVVVNETEFELLCIATGVSGLDLLDKVHRMKDKLRKTIVVTLGAAGAVAIDDAGHIYRATSLAIKPVDTVGAGDTFCGFLAAALAEKRSFEESLRIAAVAGSLACLDRGAQPSIPTIDKVLAATSC